jgi:3',5'-cyclic AMP phosphodiesterase CpdA
MAHLERPRSAARTRLAVVSDVHLSETATGSWKVFHESRPRFETALSDLQQRDVDALVLPGDLTKDGAPSDFAAVRDLLDDVSLPIVAVPGNHDVPKAHDEHEAPPLSAFESWFAPEGYPTVRSVGGVDLVCLNSVTLPDGSLMDGHAGALSKSQLSWLDSTLPDLDTPIVVMHHNLPGLGEITDGYTWRSTFPTDNHEAIVEVLSEHDVPLHVSGHVHLPAVCQTAGVRELVAPALCSFPQGYLLVDVHEAGTTVRFVPITSKADLQEAYMSALNHGSTSRAVAQMAQTQLANMPLVDEPAGDTLPPSIV